MKRQPTGAPGWRNQLSVRLQPGHDLMVREFEPRVRLWADGSEPGACFRFCVYNQRVWTDRTSVHLILNHMT